MGTAQLKKLVVEHDVEDDDSLYPTRMPSSVRRYKPSQISSVSPLSPVTPMTKGNETLSPSSRSSQSARSKSASSSKKQRAVKEMQEPDSRDGMDNEDDDEQLEEPIEPIEPMMKAPVVPRRRASLENEQRQERQATAAMQAIRTPTSGLAQAEGNGSKGTGTAQGSRGTTSALKTPTGKLEKAESERSATSKLPSATLSGRLPNTDALPRLGRLPLVAILIGMVAAILLVMVCTAFSSWWHTYQDDLHYGRPRTYQMDAVVGHGDSAAHPTHFIFLNLNRHIEITEIDGGDPPHTHIYQGPVLFGDGQDLTPVTGEIRDVNHDGKPDLIVHIQDQQIVYLNNGTIFVPQPTNQ